MNKIQKIYKILLKRLPSKYHIPIKICSTIYSALRYIALKDGKTYQAEKKYFQKYINTADYKKRTRPINLADIGAFSSNPICVMADCKKYSEEGIAATLLHEISHIVFDSTEHEADIFAKRWTAILLKEKLITEIGFNCYRCNKPNKIKIKNKFPKNVICKYCKSLGKL